GARQNDALDAAFAWLGNHGATEAAGFVLTPLLAWDADRLGARQNDALDAAFTWLGNHGATEVARFVLNPLLAWDADRLGNRADKLISSVLAWLATFHSAESADFVLVGVLDRRQPDDSARRQCAAWAMAWLDRHIETGDATHLFNTLLKTANWHAESVDVPRIIKLAGLWLDRHPTHVERRFVMARLLRLPELPDRAWLGVAARALEELNLRAGDTQDDYILSSVPVRLAGLRKEHRDLWLRLTQRWILHHGTAKAIGRLIWDCQKKSSRLVDAYVESLMSDCRQRFGPDFEVGP
ncbi:MAG: hypothetical protein Q8S20_09670, partial [Sulfuritalea sp.]|nr:hypothetical protein [Sulfuritalea sp.]